MEILDAKKAVVEAGVQLVKKGLIQRTWGNVSCRVSDTQFVITPSGRDYLSLTPDDIVLVNIADCSYEGDIKPSSEKGIHANCYRLRDNVNFVIHTHQTYASIIGLSGLDINEIEGESAKILGDSVPLAAYGLPGTKKLKNGVVDALLRAPSSNACLMLHHGALCVGNSLQEAFTVANELEKVCKERIYNRFYEISGNTAKSFYEIADYIAKGLAAGKDAPEIEAYDSVRSFGAVEMKNVSTGEELMVELESGMPIDVTAPLPDTAILHCEIYKNRDDVNAIVHSKEEATLAASKMGRTVKPFLDDFAQIAGFTVKNTVYDPNNALRSSKKVIKKLKRRDAVLLKDNGAVCVGKDEDEANAVKLVAEKGCKAFTAAEIYGKGKNSIVLAESILMRVIYKAKYSKKK
ncbi:MAG: class II aldolase/adducin family protein [Oscillospiraceae bacterium]|nr:class II aldolase/adducin family protein [Oscillospiraceae bacterium]